MNRLLNLLQKFLKSGAMLVFCVWLWWLPGWVGPWLSNTPPPLGLGPRSRVGQGPVRPPRGWAPEAEWGRAPCDRRGAGPQKPSGARPCATAVGLGPRSSSKCGAVVLGGGVCCDYSDDCAAPGGPKFST